MVDIQSAAGEIRRGIKKEEGRKKPQGKNIMSASATQGGHNKECTLIILTEITRQDWETESGHVRAHCTVGIMPLNQQGRQSS